MKKMLSFWDAPGVLKNVTLPLRTIENIGQPREKNALVDTRPYFCMKDQVDI